MKRHGGRRRASRSISTGAPPQLPQGGLNCTLNYTEAHATYPLKCMLTPERARQCRLLPAVHGEGAGRLRC
jgi:hypothetical protein